MFALNHAPDCSSELAIIHLLDLSVGYVRNNLVTIDFMQLAGIPDKEEGRRRKLGRPASLPMIDIPSTGEGILVFDDYTHAMRDIQNMALDLTIERRIRDTRLGPGWLLVFCGNDVGGVFPLSAGLANRFAHYYVEADLPTFKDWGLKNGIIPQILGFLESDPSLLSIVPKKQEMAYPTPRSWDRASGDLVDRFGDQLPANEEVRSIVASEVGTSASSRFIAYLRTYALIDFQEVMKGTAPPLSTQAKALGGPEEAAIHALSYSLCAHARSWWLQTRGRRTTGRSRGDVVVIGHLLVYLGAQYATHLLRDLSALDKTRALRVQERAASEPGFSHVLDRFTELGKIQTGLGVL